MTHITPLWDQDKYRFRNDDGTETTATWKAASDTDVSIDINTPFRIRFVIQETAGGSGNITNAVLQYNLAGGGWVNVGTTTPIKWATSAFVTDGTVTTQQISILSYLAGYYDDNGSVAVVSFSGNERCEFEYCVSVDGTQVSDGQTFQLRVVDGTTPFATYTVTPTGTANVPNNALLANDVESASQVSAPVIFEVQNQELLADDIETTSEVGNTSVGQSHTLNAVDVESASETSSAAQTTGIVFLAEDIQSFSTIDNTEVYGIAIYGQSNYGSRPALTEEVSVGDNLLADDVQSTSEVGTPSVGQAHVLSALSVQSASEVETVEVGQEHELTSTSVESSSQVDTVDVAQIHVLTANDVQSTSEITVPAMASQGGLLAEDVQSASEVSIPAITSIHALTSVDVESTSEVTAPNLAGEGDIFAEDVESTSEVGVPTLNQIHIFSNISVQSATEVGVPTLAGVHVLTANDVQSSSEVDTPALATPSVLNATDIESSSEVSVPSSSQIHVFTPVNIESASEVSNATITQVQVVLSTSIQSLSELTVPRLFQLAPAAIDLTKVVHVPEQNNTVIVYGEVLPKLAKVDQVVRTNFVGPREENYVVYIEQQNNKVYI